MAPSTHRQKYLLRERELADLLDRATALRGRWKALLVRDPRQYFTLTRRVHGGQGDPVRAGQRREGRFHPQPAAVDRLALGGMSCSAVSWPWKPRTWGNWRCISVPNSGVTVPPASRVGRDYFARLDTDCVAIRHESARGFPV